MSSRFHVGRLGMVAAAVAMLLAGCGQKPAKAKLLVTLPDYCPTPDGMAMDAEGNIVVACPNYADKDKPVAERRPAVFIKIDKQNKVTKWFECPVMEESGIACPMGIAFGPDGDLYVCDNQNWPTGNGDNGERNEGRLLRLRVAADGSVKTTIVAEGISHPNGVRVHKGKLYVTVSMLPKIKNPDGLLVSAVYRFDLDDEGIKLTNTRDDPNLFVEFKTLNKDCQYGMDGIVFDSKGALFVGNFGDGALHKVTLGADGSVKESTVFAKTNMATPMYDPPGSKTLHPDFKTMMVRSKMRTTDGICIDAKDNIYVADFSNNAIAKVSPAGEITVITQNGDTDGSDGQLDQPGEPIVRGSELVVTCFDMVTGPDKVNTKHDKPYTICTVELE